MGRPPGSKNRIIKSCSRRETHSFRVTQDEKEWLVNRGGSEKVRKYIEKSSKINKQS